jgi:hypothetical protein
MYFATQTKSVDASRQNTVELKSEGKLSILAFKFHQSHNGIIRQKQKLATIKSNFGN